MAEGGGDSGPASGRSSTAPGLGGPSSAPGIPSSGRRVAAHDAHASARGSGGQPAAVDFEALSAALGDRSDHARAPATESQGRSSASYASSRPHSVPPAHTPVDPDVPAVIVTVDDTVPSAPPVNMTVPLAPSMAMPHMPMGAVPVGPPRSVPPASAPGMPSSGPGSLAPVTPMPSPYTPPPFPVQRGVAHPTMRMPERPRRPRAMTVVVRPRGPSAAQKLVAFMAMLVLVTACGIAVIIWRKPGWLGLVPPDRAAAATPAKVVPVAPPASVAETAAPPPTLATPAASVAPTASAHAPGVHAAPTSSAVKRAPKPAATTSTTTAR